MPILGAHVDSSGGLHLAFERARAMGADAIQVHPTPPGFWGSPKLDDNRIATFKEAAARHGKPPFYFHAGSHKGGGFDARLPQITEHLRKVLERAEPRTARLLIENNAGLGGCVGARFEEIQQMLDSLDNDRRVSVCFDTCHA